MSPKKSKPGTGRIPRSSVSPIAEGEIDVLKYIVKSTLGKGPEKQSGPDEISFGNVRVNFVRHELFRNGTPVGANAREFQILRYFLQHEGEVVSRDRLLADVWGFETVPTTRSVDNYILSLRKKIEDDAAHPRYLLTFRNAGYKFLR